MLLFSLGFGLAVSWLWLFYLVGPLLEPLCILWDISSQVLFRYFIGSNCLTSLLLSQLLNSQSICNKKYLLIASTITLSSAPLLTALLPLTFPAAENPGIAIVLAILSGIALAFFYTGWLETMSRKSLKQNSLAFATGVLLASSVTLLAGSIHYYWLLPLLVLAPPLSLLSMLHQQPDTYPVLTEHPKVSSCHPCSITLIVLIISIYLAGGTIFAIISMDRTFVDMFYLSNISYTIFCLIASLSFHHCEAPNLDLIFRAILPLLALGFFIFCFQEHSWSILAFVLLQGGLALLDMYTWLLFPFLARFSTRPTAVCAFGLFVTTFSVFASSISVDWLSTLLSGGHNVKNLAFIAGALSISLMFVLLYKKNSFFPYQLLSETKAPDLEPPKEFVTPNMQQPLDIFISLDHLSLTSREKDVLSLLLKGRNARYISENLYISNNTVKFHTRNIYNKLSINNRQELLTLFDNSIHSERPLN